MSELKNSIRLLFAFVMLVLGIANIQVLEDSGLNFTPFFFVLFAVTILSELALVAFLIKRGVRISIYSVLILWGVVYGLVWFFYWRVDKPHLSLQIHILQLILLELSAGLAYQVAWHLSQIDTILDGLSFSTYPNRSVDSFSAEDRIQAEFTRSRRYHHPLSLLVLRLDKVSEQSAWEHIEPLQRDMLRRFATAKVSQIISDLSRQTDIIVSDRGGQFVIVCPETDAQDLAAFAERIRKATAEKLKSTLAWGVATFPDEALTYEDLLQTARRRFVTEEEQEQPEAVEIDQVITADRV
jgi:GGDEF domain-containing protein